MYPEIIFKKKTKKQDFYKLLKMGNDMKKARFVETFFYTTEFRHSFSAFLIKN